MQCKWAMYCCFHFIHWACFTVEFEGNANDEQGINNGQLTNGALIVNDASRGNVLSLVGTNDFVNVPDSSSLDITNEISLGVWVNLNSFTSSGKIIVKPATGGTDPWELYTLDTLSNGTVRFILSNGSLSSQGGWQSVASTSPLTLSEWHHIVGTYDGTTMRLYLDSVLLGLKQFH